MSLTPLTRSLLFVCVCVCRVPDRLPPVVVLSVSSSHCLRLPPVSVFVSLSPRCSIVLHCATSKLDPAQLLVVAYAVRVDLTRRGRRERQAHGAAGAVRWPSTAFYASRSLQNFRRSLAPSRAMWQTRHVLPACAAPAIGARTGDSASARQRPCRKLSHHWAGVSVYQEHMPAGDTSIRPSSISTLHQPVVP